MCRQLHKRIVLLLRQAKVQALLDRAQFMPSALSGVHLEVRRKSMRLAFCISGSSRVLVLQIRDITTNKEWWEAYSLVIPVLTFADTAGNSEVSLRARLS